MNSSDDLDQRPAVADERFVRALVRRFVSDPHLADDVVQETWLALIQHMARGGHSTGGWLSTVARNFALQTLRGNLRRRRRETIAALLLPSAQEAAGQPDSELQQRILAAVEALAPAYRQVVRLRFYDDLMPTQIADRTGTPVETVRTRLRRALDQLRRALQRR